MAGSTAKSFYIPSRLEDLENGDVLPEGSLVAQLIQLDHLEPGQFQDELARLGGQLAEGGVDTVVDQANFDLLYSLLRVIKSMSGKEVAYFATSLTKYLTKAAETLELLQREARGETTPSPATSQSPEQPAPGAPRAPVDPEKQDQADALYTCVKVFAFALTKVLLHIEKKNTAYHASAAADMFVQDGGRPRGKAGAKRARKPAAKRGGADGDSPGSEGEIEIKKDAVLNALILTLSSDSVERHDTTYLAVLCGVASSLLESPANVKQPPGTARASGHAVKDAIFELLLMLARKFYQEDAAEGVPAAAPDAAGEEGGAAQQEGQVNQVVATLSDLVCRFEHIPKHAAAFCGQACDQGAWGEQLVDRLVSALCDVAVKAGGEVPEAKHIGTFLTDLADALPQVALRNITKLHDSLAAESHSVRKAVLNGFTRIINTLGWTAESRQNKKVKAELLAILAERVHDVQPWVRVASLNNIRSLYQTQCLNVNEQRLLLTNVVGRLKDKNSFVRHAAMITLSVALANNLVGDVLRLSVFKQYYEKKYEEVLAFKSKEEIEDFIARSIALGEADIAPDIEGQVMDQATMVLQTKHDEALVRLLYYHTACGFISEVDAAVPSVLAVLRAKSTSDAVEAIKLLSAMIRFKVTSAVDNVMKICIQVFNREQSVADAVVDAFLGIVSGPEVTIDAKTDQEKCMRISQEVIRVLHGASEGGISSVSQILRKVGPEFCGDIADTTLDVAEGYASPAGAAPPSAAKASECRSAMRLFSMIAESCPEIAFHKLHDLCDLGVKHAGIALHDPLFAKYTCDALATAANSPVFTPLKASDPIFYDLCLLLLSQCASVTQWVPLARSVVTAVYALCSNPERIVEEVIKKLSNRFAFLRKKLEEIDAEERGAAIAAALPPPPPRDPPSPREGTPEGGGGEEEEAQPPPAPEGQVAAQPTATQHPEGYRRKVVSEACHTLSRILFILGETALRQLAFAEKTYKAAIASIHATSKEAVPEAQQPQAKRRRKGKQAEAKQEEEAEEDGRDAIEAELGLESKGAKETHAEEALREEEARLLSDRSVWGRCKRLVLRSALKQDEITSDIWVKSCATLALAMYMMVTEDFARSYLQYLFSILRSAREPSIRANLIIAVGDLLTRWPNTMEPWTPFFFETLRDKDVQVRSTAYLVSSHLILNDMLKARSFVHIMLAGIVDPAEAVQQRAQLFLHEFATRDRVFQGLPDILSALSRDPAVDSDSLRTILKQMLAYIDKDKQTETLIGRLCLKFTQTTADGDNKTQADGAQKNPDTPNATPVVAPAAPPESAPSAGQEGQGEGVSAAEQQGGEPPGAVVVAAGQGGEAGAGQTEAAAAAVGPRAGERGGVSLDVWQARHIAECLSLMDIKQTSERAVKKLVCDASFKNYARYLSDDVVVSYFDDIADKVRKVVPGTKERADVKALIDDWEKRIEAVREQMKDTENVESKAKSREAESKALRKAAGKGRASGRKRPAESESSSDSSSEESEEKPKSKRAKPKPKPKPKPKGKRGRAQQVEESSSEESSEEEEDEEEEESEATPPPAKRSRKAAAKPKPKPKPKPKGKRGRAKQESSSEEASSSSESSEPTPKAKPAAKRGRRKVTQESDSSSE